MIKKKVCLIGAFGVGKTSLVSRFVKGIFSEKYLTTIGVKIDTRDVEIDGTTVRLVLWDMAGEDEFRRLRVSYLEGASGCLFVADGTRADTVGLSASHIELTRQFFPEMPGLLLVNKSDLTDEWAVDQDALSQVPDDVEIIKTSAKLDSNVEAAFYKIAAAMIRGQSVA